MNSFRESTYGLLRKVLFSWLIVPIAVVTSILLTDFEDRSLRDFEVIDQVEEVESVEGIRELQLATVEEQIIEEVGRHMLKVSRDVDNSLPSIFVKKSIENDIDLVFMMAQAEIETAYGTQGIGRPNSKKSLFGVMRGDYATYGQACDDWCKILKKSYLSSTRDEKSLMENYVTKSGYRYAEDIEYEGKLRGKYYAISKTTGIHNLLDEYTKLSSDNAL